VFAEMCRRGAEIDRLRAALDKIGLGGQEARMLVKWANEALRGSDEDKVCQADIARLQRAFDVRDEGMRHALSHSKCMCLTCEAHRAGLDIPSPETTA
jgi:hypothetical protein